MCSSGYAITFWRIQRFKFIDCAPLYGESVLLFSFPCWQRHYHQLSVLEDSAGNLFVLCTNVNSTKCTRFCVYIYSQCHAHDFDVLLLSLSFRSANIWKLQFSVHVESSSIWLLLHNIHDLTYSRVPQKYAFTKIWRRSMRQTYSS